MAQRSLADEYWHQMVLTARRSLTLLETHPRVDRDKLGAYGVSAGGFMSWMLAAVDKRVKTIVPIYGAGAAFRDRQGLPLTNVTPELARKMFLEAPGNPLFYAPLVTCPVLYMSGSNDGAFNQDQVIDTIDAVGSKVVRLCYTPRGNHHMEPPESRSLPIWMDWQLKGQGGPWPRTPAVAIGAVEGVPQIRVTPDDTATIEKVAVYYCLEQLQRGAAVLARWRKTPPRRKPVHRRIAVHGPRRQNLLLRQRGLPFGDHRQFAS